LLAISASIAIAKLANILSENTFVIF